MDQREYAESLSHHDIKIDSELISMKDDAAITYPRWLKKIRVANDALQWLCTNTRPDLCADTTISAGASGVGIMKSSKLHFMMSIRMSRLKSDKRRVINYINPKN